MPLHLAKLSLANEAMLIGYADNDYYRTIIKRRKLQMFKTELTVRYSETDQMGVVHHSRYFPWFEVGRTEFFKSTGMSYADVESQGILLPLVDCYAKFIEGAKYADEIILEVRLTTLKSASCKFEYNVIRKSDGKTLTKGYTTHAFTTPQFKPLNLKKVNPKIYNVLKGMMDKED